MKSAFFACLAAGCVISITLYRNIGIKFYFDVNFGENSNRPCACNRCLAGEDEDDAWFTERYKKSVPLLMNRTNSALDGGTKRWWLRLQPHRGNKNYDSIVEKLFLLFPDKDHYNDNGPDRCRTCAVVGNSANLNGSHYGPLIDAHDFVLRLNSGPTEGYEVDVGSRTTHRVFYPVSATDLDNSTHLVLLPFKPVDLEWLISIFTTKHITHTHTKVKSTIKASKDMVMIINPQFMKYVFENWMKKKGRYPTTGFFVIIFSLYICDQVNVFGFGADQRGRWGHYYDKMYHLSFNTGNHKGGIEHGILQELANRNKIRIFRGW